MRLRHAVAAAMLLAACAGASAQDQKTCYHAAPHEKEVGYCAAVRVGNTLYISGEAAGGDMPGAIANVYGGLKKTLAAHGLTFANVVKENVYATDLDAFIKHKALRKAMYGDAFPAATWVQVARLYTPALVLEVDVVAVFP